MTEAEARRMRASGRVGLLVAATMITLLGLGGPVMLAVTGDPSPVLPYYPFGWAAAIGGWLWWLRAWRAGRRVRGAADRPPPSQ
jgi:hypothetical protein